MVQANRHFGFSDFVVNLMIADLIDADRQGRVALPKGGLLDQRYRGMTYQQVYDYLIQNAKNMPEQGGENQDDKSGHDYAVNGCGGLDPS